MKEAVIVLRGRVLGIMACIIAAIPLSYLMFLIGLSLEKGSVAMAYAKMRPVPLLEFAGTMSLVMLPSAMLIALANHVLGKFDKDSLASSIALGAVAAYFAFAVVCIIMIGEVPGWSSDGGINGASAATLLAAALLLLVTAPLSALYWLTTVRPERNRRKLASRSELAIRAME